MKKLPSIPAQPTDAEFNAAKQLYAEQWGDAVVSNTYLKIALLAMSLLCAAFAYVAHAVVKKVDAFRVHYVRIDAIGHAEEVKYDDSNYQPQEKEIKYFLSQFCELYYSRNKYTIRDNFRKAVLFLDTQLADSTLQAWSRNQTIDEFLSNSGPQEDIKVNRVDIEDLRTAPYKATIEFEAIYYSALDHNELKRSHYTAHFVFSFRPVGNDLIQTNPIGLTISYFREDEALH